MKYFLLRVLDLHRNAIFSRIFESRPTESVVLAVVRSDKDLTRETREQVEEGILGWGLPTNDGGVAWQLSAGLPSSGYTILEGVKIVLTASAY